MKNRFTPFEYSLKMKKLGFDEECFGVYVNGNFEPRYRSRNSKFNPNGKLDKRNLEYCTAPLWQQAFDWLLDKIDSYFMYIKYYDKDECHLMSVDNLGDDIYLTSVGTKEECVKKLIKIVENESRR